ncbi:unnamed protein product [Schistocephalus solidus]|uniref:Neurabin-1 n=1 Tax=Schistocephalus solidus TaxID=70667 RepID=A0A183SQS9_SCHSO|nr:unnamed protein product [Schistocephalus solidus]
MTKRSFLLHSTGSFWKGTEEDRQDAGFPDDVDHMMLAFHPKTNRSGNTCASGCSHPFTLRYRTNSSGCAIHQLTDGPVPNSSRSSLGSQKQQLKFINRHRASLPDDRQVTFRQIITAMNAPAEALRSSRESFDSVHSLPPVHLVGASDSPSSSCKAETVLSHEECQPITDLSDSLSLSPSHGSSKVPQSQPSVPTDAGDPERRPSNVSETESVNSSVGGETVVHDSEPSLEAGILKEKEFERTIQTEEVGAEMVQEAYDWPAHLAGASDSTSSSRKAETVLSHEECQPITDLSDSLSLSPSHGSSKVPQSQPSVSTDAGDPERRPSIVSETDSVNSSVGGETVVHESEPSLEVDMLEEREFERTAQNEELRSETVRRNSSLCLEDSIHGQKNWPVMVATENVIDKSGSLLDETLLPDSPNSNNLSESIPKAVTDDVVDQAPSEVRKGASMETVSKSFSASNHSLKESRGGPELLADDDSLHTVVEQASVEGEKEPFSADAAQSEVQPVHTDVVETADSPASNLYLPDPENDYLNESTSTIAVAEEQNYQNAQQAHIEAVVQEGASSEIQCESLSGEATIVSEEEKDQGFVDHVAAEEESQRSVEVQQLYASSDVPEESPKEYLPETALRSLRSSPSNGHQLTQESALTKDAPSEQNKEKSETEDESSKCPKSIPADTVSADAVLRHEEPQLPEELCGPHPTVTTNSDREAVTLDTNCELAGSEFTTNTQERAKDKIPVTAVLPKRHEQNVAENTRTMVHQEATVMDSFARVIVPEIRIEDYSQMPLEMTHPLPHTMASTPEFTEERVEQRSTLLDNLTDHVHGEHDETETF